MTLDDVLKLTLALLILATTFAIFGLSIHVMRVLGTLNAVLRDGKRISAKLADELLKIDNIKDLLIIVSDVIVDNVISKQLGRLRQEIMDGLITKIQLFISKKL